MDIEIKPDAKPVFCGYRRHSPILREKERATVTQMEDINVLSTPEVVGEWCSASFTVPKKHTDEVRVVADLRDLNQATLSDNYPLPLTEELLEKMAGRKWYTTLDLKSGFWQIPLTKRSVTKVTVMTSKGPRCYNVATMGLKNSPACFQRCMDNVLHGLTEDVCCVYLDDCSIPCGETFEEHLEGVRLVLQRL